MSDKVPDGWKKYKLGDIVRLNPYSIDSNFKYSQIVYLDTGSIKEGKITELKEYELTDAPSSAKRLVKHNNIVYSTVRPIQRHYGIIKNPPDNMVVSNGFVVLEAIGEIIDPYFLYYFLTLDKTIDTLEAIAEASSSVYPTFRIPVLENLTIFLPPLSEQRAIASVLSSIDDKIDLLQRENKTLEAMAETLFRQLFIKEAEKDWDKVPLSEFFDFKEGPGIRNWQFKDKGIPFINIRLISDGEIDVSKANFIDEKEANEKYKHFYLQRKDMVVSTSGTLGKTAIVRNYHLPLLLNTSVIRFRPKDGVNYSFMYAYLNSNEFHEQLMKLASGSVQLNFGPMHLKQITIQLPPKNKLEYFRAIANPIYDKIESNYSQIRTLTQLRDTLLPKLMSGKIRVV